MVNSAWCDCNIWVLAICSLMMLSVVAAIEKPSYKEDFGFNHLIIPFSVDQTLLIKNASGT
ncbi:hypothetical protein T4A_3846 [Trichinella pseudospiralis]|nr:hypothetical protein T4E_10728 [Trichinella pseudospiralis]KRY68642.1 hypothetical protein T4A_6253 [Trichinella pseudospiralis]KRY74056.1 hypothetical protein T4A_3846 [Trichinella pseudospiralis]KRY87643.1 hypothetical protein T4D_8607 [Trichinella pseudospiralis]KRZ37254.1 hypothetical protein T4C_4647 [Trichinella pseudospiralis]